VVVPPPLDWPEWIRVTGNSSHLPPNFLVRILITL
jgi:hypothetical protein